MTDAGEETRAVLVAACNAVGWDGAAAQPIRLAENAIWRLPGGVVARIAKTGQWVQSQREVSLARWLIGLGMPVVRPRDDVEQPILAKGRPVTFWDELPPHEHGTVVDVAKVIKQLHSLPSPGFDIGSLDPFVRLRHRIEGAEWLSPGDSSWLGGLLGELEEAWRGLPDGLPQCVVHGDAWVGNLVRAGQGKLFLLDLERCSFGRPEWDLVSTAVKLTTMGAISPREYAEFCQIYGVDVTAWPGFNTMRSTRELRMTTYAAQHAVHHVKWRREAQHRVDCLRGRVGQRPWHWDGIM